MMPLLFVVDSEYCRKFIDRYSGSKKQFDSFRVTTLPDVDSRGNQVRWRDVVPSLIDDVQEKPPGIALAVAHEGVFRDYLSSIDREKAEVRVAAVEREVTQKLGANPTIVYAKGFHHVTESDLSRLLKSPEDLGIPGFFKQIRSAIEEGGGPLGKVSLSKHRMMGPFASIRLLLQIEPSRGEALDSAIVARIASAVAAAGKTLDELAGAYEATETYTTAIANARGVLARDPATVTANAAAFNAWLDALNDAVDDVRVGAR